MPIVATMTPDQAGYRFGQLVMLALLGVGAFKCWSISRRPATNTKCALGLMFMLGAWWVIALASACFGSSVPLRPLVVLFTLGGFALMLSSVILSIIGLVEYAQAAARYQQGRAQAIWALAICGVFGVGVVGNALRMAMRPGLARQSPAGAPLVFYEYNFRIKTPARPWVQTDAARINPDARVAFMRALPDMYFMIIAEKTGSGDLSVDTLSELAQGRLRSVAESVQVIEKAPSRIGQLAGVRLTSNVQLSGKSIRYVQSFGATNGWAYQLMAWGKQEDAQLVDAQASRFSADFELLDPNRLSPIAARNTAVDFLSTNYQFAVRCAQSGWLLWKDREKDCAYASFGVLHQQDAALVVSAVSLMGLDPEPEVIYRGLLAGAGKALERKDLEEARPIHTGPLSGIELEFERASTSGKAFTYRVQALYGSNSAYLVASWISRAHPQKDKFLADALSRVTFLDGPFNAPAPEQMTANEKQVHRIMLNGMGLVYYEQSRFERSARFFRQALALDNSEHDTPYLGNLVDACLRTGNYQEALSELQARQQFVDSQPNLQAREALLQTRLGQVQLALTNYQNLFAGGYTSEDDFRQYIQLLSQTEQPERALKETEKYLQRHDVPSVRLVQAGLLKNQRAFNDAALILETQRRKHPFDAGISYSLGDCYILAGKPSEAYTLSQEVLKEQGPSKSILILKGRAEMALKWYREAKRSFERAAKDAPDDTDVKGWLSAVSGVLGQGANSLVKTRLEPVGLPAELGQELPAPPADYGAENGAYYSRRISAISFERRKELKNTEYVTIHILNAEGVSAFSTFQIRFHPLTEELYVNKLEVRDPSGALVSECRVDDFYVLDEAAHGLATSRKVLHIPIAGLQAGSRIEASFTRREFGAAKEFAFLPVHLARPFPVQQSIVYLRGETNAVRWACSPGVSTEVLPQGICWRCKEPGLVRWEPLLPPVMDYAPMLWLADATARWPDLVSDYLDALQPRLEWPADFRDLAARVTQGATNLEQKIAAVALHVQTNYTYKAIEFGRRARDPQSLQDILRNKYGDCKDHALLTQQLLKAAGVPASLALVSFDSVLRQDLPSLDQFNHMLVYVPGGPHDRFLDCTAKSADLTADWTLELSGRTALILEKDAPRFIQVPPYPTNANVIRLTRSIQFTNQLEALVNETVKFEGVHAAFMRAYLRGQSAGARRAYVAREMVSPSAELLDLAIGALDDARSPLVIRLSSLVRGQFEILGNQLAGSPMLGMERAFFEPQPVEQRRAPFETSAPLTLERTVNIALPPGFKPAPEASSERALENRFVSSRTRLEILPTGWRLDSRLFEPAQRGSAEEYAGYRVALRDAVDSLRPRLVAERLAQ